MLVVAGGLVCAIAEGVEIFEDVGSSAGLLLILSCRNKRRRLSDNVTTLEGRES